MNFKRNCFAIIALIGSALVVTSCQDPNAFYEYQNIAEAVDTHEEFVASDGSYKKPGDYQDYEALINKDTSKFIGNTYEILST